MCFIDEMDFIKNYITNNYYRNDSKYPIVINTAQKGTAIGRKSLIPAFCDLYGLCHTNSNPYVVSLARKQISLQLYSKIKTDYQQQMIICIFPMRDGY